jgi:uncharacterized membrane protein
MSLFKKIFALCLVPYVFWLVCAYQYHFIDNLNLVLHEGGHFFFSFLGEWLHTLGGTLFQLFVPLAFALYFLFRRQKYVSALFGVWLGESMMYMDRYMSDAKDQLLQLVGGGIHDWNWMFSRMDHFLEHCKGIALFFHVLASIIVLVSVAYMIYDAFKRRKSMETGITPLTPLIEQAKKIDESRYADGDSDKPNWSVWRQDDNGNVVLVTDGLTRAEALQLIAKYEAKGHKQTYWAQEKQ